VALKHDEAVKQRKVNICQQKELAFLNRTDAG
jgi:hypothetical protein